MRKLVLIMGLTVIAIGCREDAGAQSASSGCSDCMRHVGYTSEALPGYSGGIGGVFQHYQACQTEFGPGHRSCTVSEILDTTNLAPFLTETESGQATHAWVLTGASGCFAGPVSTDLTGVTVTSRGRFGSQVCTERLPIACCGPR
jgi:hypothetical protein